MEHISNITSYEKFKEFLFGNSQISDFLSPIPTFDICATAIKKQERQSIISNYFVTTSNQQIITDIEPYEYVELYVNINMKIPKNHLILVREKLSSFKKGLIINGLIKEDYTDEWYISVINISKNDIDIIKDEKIAEAILVVCPSNIWNVV